MSDLIARDDAIALIETRQKELWPVGRYSRRKVNWADRGKYDAWQEIIDALEALPTINPEDLRPKGLWIETIRGGNHNEQTDLTCCLCGETFEDVRWPHKWKRCPNCGAKMDK